jgi:exopolysaccharide biosynthesis polyprenyl glycosylphosphotransferase
MRNNASFIYSFFLIVGDFVVLLVAFIAAYFLRFEVLGIAGESTIPGSVYALAIASTLPIWILIHALIGLYSQSVYERRFAEIGRLLIGSVIGIMAALSYDFFNITIELFPGRLVPIYGALIGFGFLVVFRSIARWLRKILFRYGIGVSNVLIVGKTESTKQMAKALKNTSRTGQKVVATVGHKVKNIACYSTFQEAVTTCQEPIHNIIQTELYHNTAKNNEILLYAQENHASYRFVPGNSDLFVGDIKVDLFSGVPVVAVSQTPLTGWGRIVKRLFDIFFSLLILIVLSPLLILIALLVKLSDPRGPILFKQTRLTRFDTPFTVYKFRSMKSAYSGMSPEEAFAKMGKPKLAKTYRKNGDFIANDPRVTKIGTFLRKTSLDELAQLINVIKGDLSLVGPRALVPEELKAYAKRHAILSVKSGITGLAQISGRRNISFEERRKLDIYYVQNWSFWLDISILLRTIRAVLSGIGAK